jgi:hypothetical protein
LPCVDPDAEGQKVVDPFFRIAFVFIFAGDGFSPRKSVRTCVFFSWDMNEFETKEKNCCNPAIHGGVGLSVGVAEHAFDELCIHFYDEVSDADDVYAECTECAE